MVDVAKLDAMLKGSRAVETPKRKPPPTTVSTYLTDDVWPACFDIDRFPAPPPIEIQPQIGPPASRLLIRGPNWKSDDWVRAADLPQYAVVATEYHRGNNHWLSLLPEWLDERNWTDGYWRPQK